MIPDKSNDILQDAADRAEYQELKQRAVAYLWTMRGADVESDLHSGALACYCAAAVKMKTLHARIVRRLNRR